MKETDWEYGLEEAEFPNEEVPPMTRKEEDIFFGLLHRERNATLSGTSFLFYSDDELIGGLERIESWRQTEIKNEASCPNSRTGYLKVIDRRGTTKGVYFPCKRTDCVSICKVLNAINSATKAFVIAYFGHDIKINGKVYNRKTKSPLVIARNVFNFRMKADGKKKVYGTKMSRAERDDVNLIYDAFRKMTLHAYDSIFAVTNNSRIERKIRNEGTPCYRPMIIKKYGDSEVEEDISIETLKTIHRVLAGDETITPMTVSADDRGVIFDVITRMVEEFHIPVNANLRATWKLHK